MRLKVGVLAVALVAGCSEAQPAAVPAPTSSQGAADAIAAKGLGCTDYVHTVPTAEQASKIQADYQAKDRSLAGPAPAEFGRCTIGGVNLVFVDYNTPAEAEEFLATAQSTGCSSAESKAAIAGKGFVLAGKSISVLFSGDLAVSERLAAAAGGTLRVIRCP